jgi:hypothetical protein
VFVKPSVKDVSCTAPYATWFTMRGRNLITGLTSAASPRVDILNTCKVGQKLGVSVPLLTCSPSAWPSRLLYRRGRKSRRTYDLSCICQFFIEFSRALGWADIEFAMTQYWILFLKKFHYCCILFDASKNMCMVTVAHWYQDSSNNCKIFMK